MAVTLTSEQESELSRMAAQAGRGVNELAREAVDRYLAEEQRFAAAVRISQQAASEGNFIPASEAWAGVEAELNA